MSMRKIWTPPFFLARNLADMGVPNGAKEAQPDERTQARKTGAVFAEIG